MSEVRIYVEGGGDDHQARRFFRQGFRKFLDPLYEQARRRGIRFHPPIPCGGNRSTLEDFAAALDSHSADWNLLLLDAEGPVTTGVRDHVRGILAGHAGLGRLSEVPESRLHLMVEIMESWFLADVDAVAGFYGPGFHRASLPRNPNVEKVPKASVLSGLDRATRQTQKGTYAKIRHGAALLGIIDPAKVRCATCCDRLFRAIEQLLSSEAGSP